MITSKEPTMTAEPVLCVVCNKPIEQPQYGLIIGCSLNEIPLPDSRAHELCATVSFELTPTNVVITLEDQSGEEK